MKNEKRQQQKQDLKALSQVLFQALKADEQLSLSYSGEDTLFLRINQAKIRQASQISQGYLALDFISGRRHTEYTFSVRE